MIGCIIMTKECSVCKIYKEIKDFYTKSNVDGRPVSACKDCLNSTSREKRKGSIYLQVLEKVNLEFSQGKKSCPRCKCLKDLSYFKDCVHKKTRTGKRPYCMQCEKEYHEQNRHKYLDKKNEDGRKNRVALRLRVLKNYSGAEKPFCQCCGESYLEFLSLDHIHGGGRKQKKEIGNHLYKWVEKNNYPEGFRVLCHNCNQSLGAYGYCPHKKESSTANIAA